EALREESGGPCGLPDRQSQVIPLRHGPSPAPAGRPQRRIERVERLGVDVERALERSRRCADRERDLLEPDLRLTPDVAEVLLGVAVYLERRKEREIEIAGGKAERGTRVMAQDRRDVVRTQSLDRAPHTRRAVIPCRDREGPGAEQA